MAEQFGLLNITDKQLITMAVEYSFESLTTHFVLYTYIGVR